MKLALERVDTVDTELDDPEAAAQFPTSMGELSFEVTAEKISIRQRDKALDLIGRHFGADQAASLTRTTTPATA